MSVAGKILLTAIIVTLGVFGAIYETFAHNSIALARAALTGGDYAESKLADNIRRNLPPFGLVACAIALVWAAA